MLRSILLAGLLLACHAQDGPWDLWWNYGPGISGPSSWAAFNTHWRLCGIGKRQSPIDIIPADLLFDRNLKHISLSKHRKDGMLRNTGHDLTFFLDKEEPSIDLQDGPLGYQYKVDKVIIHFGSTNKQGSEHRVDGKSFPAEIQIMAYNSVLYPNMTVAEESHAGVAAISVLVSINDTEPSALGDLIQHVASIQFRDDEVALSKISIYHLLPDTRNYMTYEGSLTRPGCYEVVTWIIINKPVYITQTQLDLLRQTLRTAKTGQAKLSLEDNFRPIQSVNRRAIRTNINFPAQRASVCDVKREKTYTANNAVLKDG